MAKVLAIFLIAMFSVCLAIKPRSSSGAGVAPQYCGNDNTAFYCPLDRQCKPREQRCTGSDVCLYPSASNEGECYPTTNQGQYQIRQGHAKLYGSSSKKRFLELLGIEHQFVTFRGLTYEFGKSYGVQILDTLDPQYKYINRKDVYSISTVGSSYCTWQEATAFANMWNTKYSFASNNCKDFAEQMIKVLKNGPCNRPPTTSGKRRKRQEDQQAYINTIIEESTECSANSAVSAITHSWAMALPLAACMASLLH